MRLRRSTKINRHHRNLNLLLHSLYVYRLRCKARRSLNPKEPLFSYTIPVAYALPTAPVLFWLCWGMPYLMFLNRFKARYSSIRLTTKGGVFWLIHFREQPQPVSRLAGSLKRMYRQPAQHGCRDGCLYLICQGLSIHIIIQLSEELMRINRICLVKTELFSTKPVSYTHLTLPTNREV